MMEQYTLPPVNPGSPPDTNFQTSDDRRGNRWKKILVFIIVLAVVAAGIAAAMALTGDNPKPDNTAGTTREADDDAENGGDTEGGESGRDDTPETPAETTNPQQLPQTGSDY